MTGLVLFCYIAIVLGRRQAPRVRINTTQIGDYEKVCLSVFMRPLSYRVDFYHRLQESDFAIKSRKQIASKLLLLDEPSLGLAPPLVSQALGRIQQISKDAGMTVVIVEQKVREVLKIAHRVYVLRTGRISFAGAAEELKEDAKLREVYL